MSGGGDPKRPGDAKRPGDRARTVTPPGDESPLFDRAATIIPTGDELGSVSDGVPDQRAPAPRRVGPAERRTNAGDPAAGATAPGSTGEAAPAPIPGVPAPAPGATTPGHPSPVATVSAAVGRKAKEHRKGPAERRTGERRRSKKTSLAAVDPLAKTPEVDAASGYGETQPESAPATTAIAAPQLEASTGGWAPKADQPPAAAPAPADQPPAAATAPADQPPAAAPAPADQPPAAAPARKPAPIAAAPATAAPATAAPATAAPATAAPATAAPATAAPATAAPATAPPATAAPATAAPATAPPATAAPATATAAPATAAPATAAPATAAPATAAPAPADKPPAAAPAADNKPGPPAAAAPAADPGRPEVIELAQRSRASSPPPSRALRRSAPPAQPPRTRPPETSPPHLLLGLGGTSPPPLGLPTPVTGVPAPAPGAETGPTMPIAQPGVDDLEVDPIALATLAIQRLRARARTDLASFRVQYQRLDGLVLVFASLIVFGAGFVHRRLVEPPQIAFEERGLRFHRTAAWLAPLPVPPPPPRLIRDPNPRPDDEAPYHVEFTSSVDREARLEVFIDQQPTWSNIVTGLELDRRTRFGELYAASASEVHSIEGHDWLRTPYRFAHAAEKGDDPSIGRAVEYAAVDREQIYIVTFSGTEAQIERMEEVVAPTLRVESRTGLPLMPQVGRLSRRAFPAPVGSAFQSSVMVVVADLVNGRLRARGGGSGVIVGRDGSILTNFHVLHDHDGDLHDVFVIGRFTGPDSPPTLVCAGRPSRSKLQREVDLALVKCDVDLDGRAWTPARWGMWPTIPSVRLDAVESGERIWVLGYPDVGGGGPTLSQGQVEGLTGEDGGIGQDYVKTDAAINNGNSGGAAVDDQGRLIGIATAFRIKITASGGIIETAKIGLVRPLAAASDLLAIATAGWTPREGHTTVDLEPNAVDAPAEGIRIETDILDEANKSPINGALLLVLRPGVAVTDIDMNRLDDLVIAWGRSNVKGKVHLKQPVPAPGTYSVMVVASGYEPLIGANALKLGENAPAFFNPWGVIWLESK